MRSVEPTPEEEEAIRAGHEHLTWQIEYLKLVVKIGAPIFLIFNVAAWSEGGGFGWMSLSILLLVVIAVPGLNTWHPAFRRQREAERAHSKRMEEAGGGGE